MALQVEEGEGERWGGPLHTVLLKWAESGYNSYEGSASVVA